MKRPALLSLLLTVTLAGALALPAFAGARGGGGSRGGGAQASAGVQQRLRDRSCLRGTETRNRAENRVGNRGDQGARKRLRDGSCLTAPAPTE